MPWFKALRSRFTRNPHPIADQAWQTLMQRAAIFHRLNEEEQTALRQLTSQFLRHKTINGAHDFIVTDEMKLAIAAQACLMILKLDLDYFDGWVEIVLYPQAFRVTRDQIDASGVVSPEQMTLSGEAWSHGEVILSWADIARDLASPHPGHNVVIHELAHKLDMLNGSANGMPPLHAEMVRKAWTAAFSAAFEQLQQQSDQPQSIWSQLIGQQATVIDDYAATDPAEFFAVMSEYFFTAPATLRQHYPEVYQQLALFYRQQPA